jgi:hypothetical protein
MKDYVRTDDDDDDVCEACLPITTISEKLGLRETLTKESIYIYIYIYYDK